MQMWLADPPFFGGPGQGARQIIELFVAFGLTSLIGFEREIQGKSAGVRTQTIVGTAAALIMLVSKYGFFDVLSAGTVEVDPSRVAAQIEEAVFADEHDQRDRKSTRLNSSHPSISYAVF